MSGTVYLSGDIILITDVGDSFLPSIGENRNDPGPSLVCVTSNVNTMCCRGSDNPPNGVGQGSWLYPDGNIVPGNSGNTDH